MLRTFDPAGGRLYYFTHVTAEQLKHTQAEVHGLLGQRSIHVDPSRPPQAALHGEATVISDPLELGGAAAAGGGAKVGAGTLKLSVDATGGASQGEGYIEGTVWDYEVAEISEHKGFRFARVQC